MKISILTPTRNRPQNALRFANSVIDTASDISRVEILFYVDNDDPAIEEYRVIAEKLKVYNFTFTFGEPMSVSKSWNILAEKCIGDVLVMGNDDLIYRTGGWDAVLQDETAKFPDQIYCMWFNDGLNFEKHCAFPMVSRLWYETVGYFSPGRFKFLWNDTWVMKIGEKLDRLHYVDHILVEHMHFTANKSPRDNTYNRNRNEETRLADIKMFDETDSIREEDAEKLRKFMRNK